MAKFHRHPLTLEFLESRTCPAPLNFFFDGAGNLRVTGTPDILGLTFTAVADNTFDIDDGFTSVFTAVEIPGNISVNLNPVPGFFPGDSVTFDLGANSMNGGISVSTGSGDDIVTITSTGGFIGGNVTTTAVDFVGATLVNIGGNVLINNQNSSGATFVTFDGGSVGGNFTALGRSGGSALDLNSVALGGFFGGTPVGGNVFVNFNNVGTNRFNLDPTSAIGGNLTYLGGNGNDSITLEGAIGNSVSLNLGGGTNDLLASAGSLIGGNLAMVSGLGTDSVSFGGTIGRNLYFNLGGGANTLDFTGVSGGSAFTYIGGFGVDSVTFGFGANAQRARLFLNLSLGDDFFELGTGAITSLFADFGFGSDTFMNSVGLFTFPATLRNLP